MDNLHFASTKLQGGFWSRYEMLVRRVTVPAIYTQFSDTGRFIALQCRKDIESHIYWDSDVAKWIESVAFLTTTRQEPELEKLEDEAVAQIVKNQLPNGYFNSCYITQMPEKIFQIRDNHELYCAGHLIEAAIAYDRATGKHAFLDAMCHYADYIHQVFFVEKSRFLRYNKANIMELFEAEVWLRQMARLRNFVRKIGPRGFRAVLFRMVPKHLSIAGADADSFRAVLFRMVPKPQATNQSLI